MHCDAIAAMLVTSLAQPHLPPPAVAMVMHACTNRRRRNTFMDFCEAHLADAVLRGAHRAVCVSRPNEMAWRLVAGEGISAASPPLRVRSILGGYRADPGDVLAVALRCSQRSLTSVHLQDVDVASIASHLFASVGPQLRIVTVRGRLNTASLRLIAHHCSRLTRFVAPLLESDAEEDFERLLLNCPNLTAVSVCAGRLAASSLRLIGAHVGARLLEVVFPLGENETSLQQFGTECPNVVSIIDSRKDFKNAAYLASANPRSLTALRLRQNPIAPSLPRMVDIEFVSTLPFLTTLEILARSSGPHTLNTIVKSCVRLEVLRLNATSVSDALVSNIAACLPRLRQLHLGDCGAISAESVLQLTVGCRLMEWFACSGENLTDVVVIEAASHWRFLDLLEIDRAPITRQAHAAFMALRPGATLVARPVIYPPCYCREFDVPPDD